MAWRRHLFEPRLRALFVVGATAMGGFAVAYNYLAFHLSSPPFDLAPRWLGMLFSMYFLGTMWGRAWRGARRLRVESQARAWRAEEGFAIA